MAEYLDPTLDVVFKLLFTRELGLLRAMLEAILGETLEEVRIMNPEILAERSGDKGVVMDVRVALPGKRADVEMQGQDHTALAERLLFYGTRDYSQQLRRGGRWEDLTPTVVVAWLVEPLFEDAEFHTVFELRSRADGRLYSEHLSIHVLELSRIPKDCAVLPSGRERAVIRWGRFLTARTEEEYAALATEDPVMEAAKEALERLSQDPEALRIAQEREDELKLDRIERRKWEEKRTAALRREVKAQVEQEVKAQVEREVKAQVEREVKARVEQEVTARVEQEVKAQVEQEVTARVEQEVTARVEQEVTARVEREVTARVEREVKARVEREVKARVEAHALERLTAAVLAILEARNRAVSEDQRQRILACTDAKTLEDWIRRAATVEVTDALFA